MGLLQRTDVGGMEAREDVDGLRRALSSARSPRVRLAAAEALGRIGRDFWAFSALNEAFIDDGDSRVRAGAMLALHQLLSRLPHEDLLFPPWHHDRQKK